jgi:alkanesulfonate monooxygenase SsuD/methylene tetrahydromethanopterin reductase-like flavin-dependent oxidoreductase (luciferase family)
MSRIGIAMSGGPNPAEIIDLVVLAERLGYESTWVAEGAWRRPVRHAWRPAPCGPRASWGQGHALIGFQGLLRRVYVITGGLPLARPALHIFG